MTQALHTLFEHAQRARDEGLAALQQAEQIARDLQAQAEQLQQYHDEYDARHPARGGRAAPIELLRCHLSFMQRLQQAQAQQQAQLHSARQRVAQRAQALVGLEMRVAAIRKLLDRREKEQATAAQRQEQRSNDEASQQRAWNRRREVPLASS
jgi:flagellar FliJ protein